MNIRRIYRFLCCAGIFLAGCIGTSLPEPPSLQSVDPAAFVNEESRATTAEDFGGFTLLGGPGAAPDLGEVWAWNLDASSEDGFAVAAEDGSFTMTINSSEGDRIRLQARLGSARSAPIDVVRGEGGLFPLETMPCVEAPLEVEFDANDTATIVFLNACDRVVTLSDFSFRSMNGRFAVDEAEMRIEPGQLRQVRAFVRTRLPAEDILRVQVIAEGIREDVFVSLVRLDI